MSQNFTTKIISLKNHDFASASIWMFASNTILNTGNFIFIFLLARILSPSNYTTIIALISVANLLMTTTSILQLTVVNLVSEVTGEKKSQTIDQIYKYFQSIIFKFSIICLVLFLIFEKYLTNFLKLEKSSYLLIIFVTFLLSLSVTLFKSTLQGMQKFNLFTLTTSLEIITKISILIVSFIIIGPSLQIALLSLVIPYLILIILSFFIIRPIQLNKKDKKLSNLDVLKTTLTSAILMVSLTSFYTIDIILVKHFFQGQSFQNSPNLYVAVSTIGKIIFFGTIAITSALIPITRKRYASNIASFKIFFLSIATTIMYALIIIIITFLNPERLLKILGQPEYLNAKYLLTPFLIFISIHSVAYVISMYHFAKKRYSVMYIVLPAAICQILGIFVFHKNLIDIITVSTWCSASLVIMLLCIFPTKHIKINIFQNI